MYQPFPLQVLNYIPLAIYFNNSIYFTRKDNLCTFIIWLDSFLQSDRLLVGPDYFVKTAGIVNFSKNFQNSQNNLKNDFKELWKFSEKL